MPGIPFRLPSKLPTGIDVDLYSVGSISETEAAQSIMVVKPIVISIGSVSETESPQVVFVNQESRFGIGYLVEDETANVITRVQEITPAIGSVSEAETVGGSAPIKVVPVGSVSEAETLSTFRAFKTIELNGVFPFAREKERVSINYRVRKIAHVGTVFETEFAQQLIADKPVSIQIGSVSEIETSQSVVRKQVIYRTVGTSVESETSSNIGKVITISMGSASETEAVGFIGLTLISYGLKQPPWSTPILAPLSEVISPPPPHDGPPWVYGQSKFGSEDHYGGHTVSIDVNMVFETETAQEINVNFSNRILAVVETETAQTVVAWHPLIRNILRIVAYDLKGTSPSTADKWIGGAGQEWVVDGLSMSITIETQEVEVAQTVLIIRGNLYVINVASEVETAQTVFPLHHLFISIGSVTETETAQPVAYVSGEIGTAIGTATEREIAIFVGSGSEGITYNTFIITPINNGSLSLVKLTLPGILDFGELGGRETVTFSGQMFGLTSSDIEALRGKLLDIVLDQQIVEIFYPPDNTISGTYYINSTKLDAVSIASGLYRYDIDCEKTLVSSG